MKRPPLLLLLVAVFPLGCLSLTDEEYDDLATNYTLVQVNGMAVGGPGVEVGTFQLPSGEQCTVRVHAGTLQLDARFNGFDLRLTVDDGCASAGTAELRDGGSYTTTGDSIAFVSGTGELGVTGGRRFDAVLRMPAAVRGAENAEPSALSLQLVFREARR